MSFFRLFDKSNFPVFSKIRYTDIFLAKNSPCMAIPNRKHVKYCPCVGNWTISGPCFDNLLIWVGHTEGVLRQENDLFTRFCSKLQNWIYQLNGKSVSQIFYMFDLTYSTKDSGKKISKKVAGQHTFWLGRDLGRNGCRP